MPACKLAGASPRADPTLHLPAAALLHAPCRASTTTRERDTSAHQMRFTGGATAIVYSARDLQTSGRVALKVVSCGGPKQVPISVVRREVRHHHHHAIPCKYHRCHAPKNERGVHVA